MSLLEHYQKKSCPVCHYQLEKREMNENISSFVRKLTGQKKVFEYYCNNPRCSNRSKQK